MLLDPAGSWALLVGTGTYLRSRHLADIPAIRNNLLDLKNILTDPAIGRIHPDHCIVIEDPEDEHQVADALDRIASWSTDTILFYYAGHGLIDASANSQLYLGLSRTTQRLVVANGLAFSMVQDIIGQSSATTRVVVLDCCYSGLAINNALGEIHSTDVKGLVHVEGGYVLTSSAATRVSMAPAGARHTAFTGHFLRLLRAGIPGGPRELDLETIYLNMRRAMVDEGLPEPQRLVSNTAHYLALVLNQAWLAQSERVVSAETRAELDHVATTAAVVDLHRSHTIHPAQTNGRHPGADDDATSDHTSSPTAWRRWLALELRRLRLAAGLSQTDVGNYLQWQNRKFSSMENGQRNVPVEDLESLLRLFAVPPERWRTYVMAAARSTVRGWWQEYGEDAFPPGLELFVGLEQGAERIRAYQPSVIHGLIQTPEFATLVIRGNDDHYSEEKLSRLVELRLQRQAMLWRETNAPQLWVIIDEAALAHVMGNPRVMRNQVDHVIDIVRRRQNITVQVVPFDRSQAEWCSGPFTILSFPFPKDGGLVFFDYHQAVFREAISDVDFYSHLFQQISKRALSPDDSLEIFSDYARKYARL